MRRLVATAVLLAACAPSEDDPCPNHLTWENFGHSFTSQYCMGCHSSTIPPSQRNGAPQVVNLDTYVGVLRWVRDIEAEAASDPPTMPPGGGTTAAERALLAEWLSCTVYPDARAYGAQQ